MTLPPCPGEDRAFGRALKVRKNVEWLRTRLSIGADYSTQRGLWKLQYAWEDTFIGGRMVLKGTRTTTP